MMRWPWERSDEQKIKDTSEVEYLQKKIQQAMTELRSTLSRVEHEILEDIENERG